jgi:Thiamine pyrophosphate enzyme, N-terminal TPP binding domain
LKFLVGPLYRSNGWRAVVTALTAFWARYIGLWTAFNLSRSGMSRKQPLWRPRTPGLPAEVGVCLATSGPGAIHLLNGLYDAKLDHQPVVAIVGQSVRAALGGDFQQEVDLHSLFKDLTRNHRMRLSPKWSGAALREG